MGKHWATTLDLSCDGAAGPGMTNRAPGRKARSCEGEVGPNLARSRRRCPHRGAAADAKPLARPKEASMTTAATKPDVIVTAIRAPLGRYRGFVRAPAGLRPPAA